jgi:MoxR-like ATPase
MPCEDEGRRTAAPRRLPSPVRAGRRGTPHPGAAFLRPSGEVRFTRTEEVQEALSGEGYLADRGLATAIYLAATLEQPLLLEGEAGVGKTEVARALAAASGAELIRLQCHEGIDLHHAVYDWDYGRQLLAIRAAEAGAPARELFGREFLLRRPLLEALEHEGPSVLLIDEIDRADDEFEAFLLEFLSDFAISIPELGTVRARSRPLVVLTSNRTRELHDALKRRCLYHWIDYPDPAREADIVRARLPEVPEAIALRVCDAVARLRGEELYKLPGVGETITWARALLALGPDEPLEDTLGVALKVREDIDRVRDTGVLHGA